MDRTRRTLELFREMWATEDPAARLNLRNQIVMLNYPLVYRIVKGFRCQDIHWHDNLIQVGTLGLIHAVDRFTLDYGAGFSPYAAKAIKGYIFDDYCNHSRLIRTPSYAFWKSRSQKDTADFERPRLQEAIGDARVTMNVTLMDTPQIADKATGLITDPDAPVVDLAHREEIERLRDALEVLRSRGPLEARLARVVDLHYGITQERKTLPENGREHGVCRERARQLVRQGVDELRLILIAGKTDSEAN